MRLEIKLEGDAKVRGAFKKLQDLGGIKDLCVRQAQQMEERGKAALGTPGATPRKTGDLRKSLMTDTQMPDGAAVGYTMEYAPHVNYGHRKRGGKGYVEGQHFLEANMKEQAPIFERETKEYLQRFIDAAAQGG